ncbi:c-type cytochrome [Mycolicibacterium sp.]|uniref:c-type cytochrome n=1 Tax=Mycolicibacterium sp. TaxID=2320850 RepID=UPI0037CC9F97
MTSPRIGGMVVLLGVLLMGVAGLGPGVGAQEPVREVGSSGGRIHDVRRITPVVGDVQEGERASAMCVPCHGVAGMSPVPIFPNIAGQSADYMYWELMDATRGTRPQSPMTAIVAALDEPTMRNVSLYYAGLAAKRVSPASEADAARLRRGEELYRSGDSTRGIAACVGCHGEDAGGYPDAMRVDANGYTPFAVYPSLRGQHAPYLQTRLGHYRDGILRDSTSDLVMSGIAERLDTEAIEDLSAWLASLEP